MRHDIINAFTLPRFYIYCTYVIFFTLPRFYIYCTYVIFFTSSWFSIYSTSPGSTTAKLYHKALDENWYSNQECLISDHIFVICWITYCFLCIALHSFKFVSWFAFAFSLSFALACITPFALGGGFSFCICLFLCLLQQHTLGVDYTAKSATYMYVYHT